MTREAEIAIRAIENADKRIDRKHQLRYAISNETDFHNGLTQGFEDGVEYAEADILSKAELWLSKNYYNAEYIANNTDTWGEIKEKFINDFLKAMEE